MGRSDEINAEIKRLEDERKLVVPRETGERLKRAFGRLSAESDPLVVYEAVAHALNAPINQSRSAALTAEALARLLEP